MLLGNQSRVTKARKPINLPPAGHLLSPAKRATYCPYASGIGQDIAEYESLGLSHRRAFDPQKPL
jgi:hypothetical protein